MTDDRESLEPDERRQLGGMLPGSREIVDTVVEAAHAAIAKAKGGGNG